MTDTLALLNTWPGLTDLPGDGPVIELSPLAGGAQNILSLVRRADGTELVLRLPGRHLEDRAADAFRRESGALAALADTHVPHPRQYAFSLDQDSPLGGPFSILEKIDGFTPQGRFPGRYAEDADWRRRAAFALVDGRRSSPRSTRTRWARTSSAAPTGGWSASRPGTCGCCTATVTAPPTGSPSPRTSTRWPSGSRGTPRSRAGPPSCTAICSSRT